MSAQRVTLTVTEEELGLVWTALENYRQELAGVAEDRENEGSGGDSSPAHAETLTREAESYRVQARAVDDLLESIDLQHADQVRKGAEPPAELG